MPLVVAGQPAAGTDARSALERLLTFGITAVTDAQIARYQYGVNDPTPAYQPAAGGSAPAGQPNNAAIANPFAGVPSWAWMAGAAAVVVVLLLRK